MVGTSSGRVGKVGGVRISLGAVSAGTGTSHDDAELVRAERSILEAVATGVTTQAVLHQTALAVERFVDGWRSSIMIAGQSGLELLMAAAPSLPASFIEGCQHVRVGRRGGTCGMAAGLGERVITPDVRSDPSWTPFLGWLTPYGIRAAWSTPLFDTEGTLLGTFALYHAEVNEPDDDAFEIVDRLGRLASITLSRDRTSARMASVRANLEMLIEASPAALIEVGTDLRVRLWNPAAERMFGWGAAEVVGERKPTVPDSEAEVFHERMSAALAGRVPPRIETTRVTRSGRSLDVELATAPVHDEYGDVVGVVEILTDITDRKRAEASLRAAYDSQRATVEHLRELDGAKNAFLSAVSHELRTPLTGVIGFAQTLQRAEPDDDPNLQALALDKVVANARKLDGLLTDLLDVDRLARGVIEAELAPARFDELVRGVIASCDAVATRTVHVDLQPLTGEVDAPKIERIVENLLTNAARHTPKGTPLWVELQQQEDDAHLVVADAGPGVADDDRDRIFEPFAQASDQVVPESPGVGIGLSLVARLTGLHGGQVWVDERPGGGAAFHVLLPLRGAVPA